MITEDYVSFETAKLLKAKGFDSDDVGCHGGFYSERCYESGHGIKTQREQEVGIVYDDLTNSLLDYDEYLRPTLQMVLKWLRDEHNLHICIFIGEDYSTDADGNTVDKWQFWTYHITNICGDMVYDAYDKFDCTEYQSYEETCEAAIKYCLTNLI